MAALRGLLWRFGFGRCFAQYGEIAMTRCRFAGVAVILFVVCAELLTHSTFAAESVQADEPEATAQQQALALSALCVFSRADVLARSIVGQKGNQRMQQLATGAREEVARKRKQLTADINSFSQQSASLLSQERQQRRQTLRRRQNALKQQAQRIEARIRYTRNAVAQRLGEQIANVMQSVAGQRGCALVLKRNSVALGARGRDITNAVVTALNDKVDMINFGLLQLPQLSEQNKAGSPAQ